jgi:hypothetical protein
MSGNRQSANGASSRSSTPSDLAKLPAGASAAARKTAIVEVIRRTGLHPLHAARSVGVSSSAYYRMVEGDPAFRDDIDSATSLFARRMAGVVATAAASLHSWKAAAWWLERRLPDLYGARLDLRVADASIEDELEASTTAEFRDERMEELIAEWQRRKAEAAAEPS